MLLLGMVRGEMHGLARGLSRLGLDTGLDELFGAPPIILPGGVDCHDVDDGTVGGARDRLLVEIVAKLPVYHKVVAVVSPASQQLGPKLSEPALTVSFMKQAPVAERNMRSLQHTTSSESRMTK